MYHTGESDDSVRSAAGRSTGAKAPLTTEKSISKVERRVRARVCRILDRFDSINLQLIFQGSSAEVGSLVVAQHVA